MAQGAVALAMINVLNGAPVKSVLTAWAGVVALLGAANCCNLLFLLYEYHNP